MEPIPGISGERLWSELSRIAVGHFADSVLSRMLDLGIGPYLGLPEKSDRSELFAVWQRAKDFQPQPMTVISSLLKAENVR